jgi:FMN reductase
MRAIVHSLRGWPTPLGVVVNSSDQPFGPDGTPLGPDGAPRDAKLARQLATLGEQVVMFARAQLAMAS